jgi:glycosidase
VTDHLRIDPRLGDDSDFDSLVAACHSRGIRVLVDGVFNHVSRDHDDVVAVLRDGLDSPSARLFRLDENDPQGLSRFEGHDSLVELDHSHEEVADYVVQVMNHWLERGADGWRLDAAYRVPLDFWAKVLSRVRASHPDFLSVAEVLHGDYPAMVDHGGFGSITQYELWKAIWSSLKDRNPHELQWTLTRHGGTRGHGIPWTFVSNHDVTRIATQVGSEAAAVATEIIMTLPGMPAIYYGDELGFTGLKEEGWSGDDEIRPVLTDHPGGWDEAGEYTLNSTKRAIHVRRTHPWIVDGEMEVTGCTQDQISWRVWSTTGDWLEVHVTMDEHPRLYMTSSGVPR